MSIWFESGTALDGTYKKFEFVVKELKAGTLTGPEWDSLEGKVAKVLLADQLSRNAFRGTLEAFDYEHFSLSLMSELTSPEQIKETLTLPAAYLYAMAWALAHSEKEENLAKALEFLDAAIQAYPDFTLLVNRNKVAVIQHHDVVKNFGRYPQRNAALGRENTPAEQAWLDNKDDLPIWAGGKQGFDAKLVFPQ